MDILQIKIVIAAITQTESSIYFKFFDHICDKCKTLFKYPNRYHPNPKKFFNFTALLLCESVAGTLSLSLLGTECN